MSITTSTFKITDHQQESFRIEITGNLTGAETLLLRTEINLCIERIYDLIYIDAKNVTEIDLSGINEIINTYYTLQKASKKLVFVYKKNSAIETWVKTTGLDKFIETAIIPAS